MARTTAEEVAKIREVGAGIDLNPFIIAANELVTELCEPEGYSETRLTLIETWLAAHYYSIRDMISSQERAGEVGESFQFKVDLNLSVTIYGQQAMILDTKGVLAALNQQTKDGMQRKSASVLWLGTTPTSWT